MILEKSGLSKRKEQSRLFGILIGVGVLLIIMAIMASIPVTPYAVYSNSKVGIRFKYPQAWQLVENLGAPGAIVGLVSPQQTAMDTYAESFNVSIQDLKSPMSLAQFNQLAMRQLTGTFNKEVEVVSSESDQLAGRSAYRFGYLMHGGDFTLRMMHIWVLVGNRAYIVTYSATQQDYDVFYSQVESILKSFTIR